MKYLVFVCMFLCSFTVFSQSNSGEVDKNSEEVFDVVEQMPEYPGGQDKFYTYLKDNITYPENAIKEKIEGIVYVQFVVEKDGSISNVKVLRGIGSGCDEEAVRIVKSMPNWSPGIQKGKPVRVRYNLPIKFSL